MFGRAIHHVMQLQYDLSRTSAAAWHSYLFEYLLLFAVPTKVSGFDGV